MQKRPDLRREACSTRLVSRGADQLKELIKKAEANHKDESRDVVLIEGAAGTPKEREEQREFLRRSVGSVSARRFQE